MKCTKCKKEMDLVRVDLTQNPETQRAYKREIYTCHKDDVWITIETPKKGK